VSDDLPPIQSGGRDDEETLAPPPDGAVAPVRPPIRQLGPYRLVEVLGQGGMGTVYRAEQREPVSRVVAVKVIRSTFLGPDAIRRFSAEQQAMARLAHPALARMYEAGTTPEGHPYFVMELVDGEPITDHCDRRRLGVEGRLELFAAVCDGVHHAHQKGILHRDLKPSNILVTEAEGEATPKIIDFGVAKALDDPLVDGTLLTGDRLVGTPAYLSPEAIVDGSRDLDIRSDVFSLGVILYQLLTGVLPFASTGSALSQMVQRASDEEPPGPSARLATLDREARAAVAARRNVEPRALPRQLRGDLDWIVLKAMARSREERYGSASDLAEDIRRHLAHEPVAAGPPGAWYRLRKLIRRRRGAFAAALLVLAVLVFGVVARSLEARRANREAAAARQAQHEAEEVTAFLVDLFEVSDPDRARGSALTAREVLDRGAERIRGELADQPLTRARMMTAIGMVYQRMALFEEAEPLLEEALAIRQRELPADHPDVAQSLGHLASVAWSLGRYDRAESLVRQSLAVQEQTLGPTHPDVARTLNNLAILCNNLRRREEAAELYRRALAIKESVPDPDVLSIAKTLNNLGLVYHASGRLDDAAEAYARALELKEGALPPDHPSLAASLGNLGILRTEQGRLDEAEALLGRSIAIKRNALGPVHPEVAIDLDNLADVYRAQGRKGEAEALYREALAAFVGAVGRDHPRAAAVRRDLADLLRESGRPAEADALEAQAGD